MPKADLRKYSIDYLQSKRRDQAVSIASKALEQMLPDGSEGLEDISSGALDTLNAYAGEAASNFVGRALTYPLFLMSRARRIEFSVGDKVLVRSAGRHDLVEILTKAHQGFGNTQWQLVDPAITFANACHDYSWSGCLAEFYFSEGVGDMVPHHVAWHPDSAVPAQSVSGFKVRQAERR